MPPKETTQERRKRRLAIETAHRAAPDAELLDWVVLPEGWLERPTDRRGSSAHGRVTRTANGEEDDRLRFLDTLGPQEWYRGSYLSTRIYYIALFPSVAIADCPDRGNALYACARDGENWKRVFRRSEREARAQGAVRIVHDSNSDWKARVQNVIRVGLH